MPDQNIEVVLYIGDAHISSWSLRPFLALRHAGFHTETRVIRLRQPETKAEILKVSPNGKVPCLHHGDLIIPDSLAICEYAADLAPNAKLWPEDRATRAHARAISCEMHSGFAGLRRDLSMDMLNRLTTPLAAADDALADIDRVCQIWAQCRMKYAPLGPYLFGHFTIADAMFAPVVSRFTTYNVPATSIIADYMTAMWQDHAMAEWLDIAKRDAAAGSN
jgi:glutathione S-transferase